MTDERIDGEDGGPASPWKDAQGYLYPGMSLRDWFAGQALVHLCATSLAHTFGADKMTWGEAVAKTAYGYADDMIAEREKGAKP